MKRSPRSRPFRAAAPWLALAALAVFALACSEPTPEEKLASAEETLRAAEDLRDRALEAEERRRSEFEAAKEALEAARTRTVEAQAKVDELERMLQELATDDLLFRKVQSALLDDPRLAATAISAEVRDGVVTLSGSAPDEETRAHASEVAGAILGVRDVRSLVRLPQGSETPSGRKRAEPAAKPKPAAAKTPEPAAKKPAHSPLSPPKDSPAAH